MDHKTVYALVKESFHTVSGKMGVVLECLLGQLEPGTRLSQQEHKWIILEQTTIAHTNSALEKLMSDNAWFAYFLQAEGSPSLPGVNTSLKVCRDNI